MLTTVGFAAFIGALILITRWQDDHLRRLDQRVGELERRADEIGGGR